MKAPVARHCQSGLEMQGVQQVDLNEQRRTRHVCDSS